MQIEENISLKPYNSFGINVRARYFAAFSNVEELTELLVTRNKGPLLVLGGGSNILFTQDFDGLVIRNEIKGIDKVGEDDDYVYVQVGGGENWHQFVLYCIRHNWGGVENLSLIPGSAGAAPIQNIGAYGIELKDSFHDLRAFHRKEKINYTFAGKECSFGYRESVFKGKYKDEFVILAVTLRLRKQPVFHTGYGAIEQELEKMGVKDLSVKAVSDAVISIRSSKLPDPSVTGNAGSFFKNPTVSAELFGLLKEKHPNIVGYPHTNGTIKLAAGWLIEQCGWKGYRSGDAGCHDKQALVLVNYGQAAGSEILQLSRQIAESVQERFGVVLEREVNIV